MAAYARILTLNVPRLTEKEAHRLIVSALASRAPRRCFKVYTPNPQIALGVSRSESLSSVFGRADLLLPDGIGLVLASRMLGSPLPCRITGIDTAERVLGFAERRGLRVALLGGRRGVAELAKMRLSLRFPSLRVCFTHHGYFEKDGAENERVVRALRQSRPDILFVCLGFPAQERWIDENARRIPTLRLAMGLGGALDVWSGRVKRAPRVVRNMRLEWLWRTLGDPSRCGRLIDACAFFWKTALCLRN